MKFSTFLTLSVILLLCSPLNTNQSWGKATKTQTKVQSKTKTTKIKNTDNKKNKQKNKKTSTPVKNNNKAKNSKIVKNEKAGEKILSEKQIISEWKKRKKDITPLQLKDLVEENAKLKSQYLDTLSKYKNTVDLVKKEQLEEIAKIKKNLAPLLSSGAFDKEGTKQFATMLSKLDELENNKQEISVEELNNLKSLLAKLQEEYNINNNTTINIPNSLKNDLKASEYIALLENQLSNFKEAFSTSNKAEDKAELKKIITILEKELALLRDSFPKDYADALHKGIAFQVQIGAYKNLDVSKLAKGNVYEGELHQEFLNSYNQYTLRTFRNYWDADKFKKLMRVMGIKDAWIVALKDGKRVPLKEVLKAVRKQK
jgi:hypothetical protein